MENYNPLFNKSLTSSLSSKTQLITNQEYDKSIFELNQLENKINEKISNFIEKHQEIQLKNEWNSVETQLLNEWKTDTSLKWKNFITKINPENAEKISNFRKKLDEFLKSFCDNNEKPYLVKNNSILCNTSCISSGNDVITSDIDVTIKGDCIYENLIVLLAIYKILKEIFSNSDFFKDDDNKKFDISKILIFFDMNFYLSNFAILKKPNADENCLGSYYLSDDFESQLSYVLGNKNISESENYIDKIQTLYNINQTLQISNDQYQVNKYIDVISQIAQLEDECYVTQGAFFHVVKMLQQKREFKDIEEHQQIFDQMMVCSAIENLNFAISHPNSSGKYMIRVFHAISKISNKNLYDDMFLLPLKENKIDINFVETYNKKLKNIANNNFVGDDFFNGELFISEYTIYNLIEVGVILEEEMIGIYNSNKKGDTSVNITIQSQTNNKSHSQISQRSNNNKTTNKVAKINALKQIYEDLKKYISENLNLDSLLKISNQIKEKIHKQYNLSGGSGKRFKKLMNHDKSSSIKKMILGRMRVIYIDEKRRQYVKIKGIYVPIRK